MRVEPGHGVGGALDLRPAEIGGPVDYLPLEVRKGNRVVVDDSDRPDSGGGEILDQRRAEPPGPDDQDPGGLDPGLAGAADLGEDEVAGVAFDLIGSEGHGCPLIRGAANRKR